MSQSFRVWAPSAQRVDVVLGQRRVPLRREERGWFGAAVEGVGHGDDYAFSLDGGEPRPDPRSPWQPQGVHAGSRLVDHSRFSWHDATWRGFPLPQAVLYELHPGTFSAEGTFAGVGQHLDHLIRLGVNAVELMPVAEFPGRRGWGYDGTDLYAPHHAYGGPQGLKHLVDTCHARGLAVVVDVVYNHVGPEGSYLREFGPYFTDRYASPWGDSFNYDGADSDAVREFVLGNAEMWLRDYHCDGLRLDAVHAIVDTSATHLLEALAQRTAALQQELGRELWLIAESDLNDPRLVRERDQGGYGLQAQWSDGFHHALHAALTGENAGYYADYGALDDICTALRRAFVYTGQYSRYRRRRFGRNPAGLPLHRFIGYAQNHDQVGNRATGERLCHLVSPARARMAAALTLLGPFVPLLFQGEEWAASTPFQYFTDLGDPGLQRAVSQGRRQEFRDFGWPPDRVPDPQDPATFERSRLRWDEVGSGEHAQMLDWYTELLALRRATPALQASSPEGVIAQCDAATGLLLYVNAGIVVGCNLGRRVLEVRQAVDATCLLSSAPAAGTPSHVLQPDEVGVWRRRNGG